jgi:hypothetical protein
MKPLINSRAFRFAAMLAVELPLSSAAFAVKQSPSIEVSILMGRARADAVQADKDITVLETYLLANIPWQTHFLRLEAIQVDVNNLLKDLKQLNAIKEEATPSQQDAINRLDPKVHDMDFNIRTAMKSLYRNSNTVNTPVFTDQVRASRLLINSIFNVTHAEGQKDNTLLAKESQNR